MTNSGSGERCPHLDETQMCDPQPCYHWNITVERCMLLNPNVSPACGLGTAYRTLACVNKIGVRCFLIVCHYKYKPFNITCNCSTSVIIKTDFQHCTLEL